MDKPRLLAFDEDDLIVMSAHLEGAKIDRVNMAYLPVEKRFALVAERFDAQDKTKVRFTGLHFEHVQRVMTTHFNTDADNKPLILIGMTFETTTAPSGFVVLIFENGPAVRISVECLEVSMSDLSEQESEKV